ncbi:triacylglycerol lipase [Colletotrichum tofieldiae]|uniref:Carboxylic ester hydrolase n=1 Tax=Colletotrichum tofieldiae TaxID=708197 RepID=A0A166TL97_9PEZI|nr:triacylglycerol lipase [Colletotrichum tofieldiae]GKT58559.1 triacylglycerol lipase [Colletotrichum tofieldiae]GKT78024.1 triacylglycerol lipase [Colletotrichum tofieldiae]GKT84655.1 triacylglycerol lipase [Colletotrichum tofieldiae]
MILLASLTLFLFMLLAGASCSPTPSPTARTLNGTYEGRYLPEFEQDLFLGIPYALGPRLRNSVPLNESWTDVRDATRYTVACYADYYPGTLEAVGATVGEDCLNLNIIRPSGTTSSSELPVVVWIYGGSFTTGYGGDGNTNTSYVIRDSVENGTPIIAITINYRLGFFGFPGGHQAVAEGITNLGLKDQRHALRWIQENIAAFGGDPGKVTLWGQSAGAISIEHQILAYGGKGAEELFRGGILVSGTAGLATNMLIPTHPNILKAYDNLLNATGCADADRTLDCIREAPADTVWKATIGASFPSWWPSIDGDFVRKTPTLQILEGDIAPVSVIVGANNDEGLLTANGVAASAETEADVALTLRLQFPAARDSTIQKVLAAYPVDAPSPPYSLPVGPDPANDVFCAALREANMTCGAQYRRMASIYTDYAQVSGRRLTAREWARAGIPAYSYRFDTNPTDIPIVKNALAPGFSTHSAEYAYFFNFPPGYYMHGLNPPVRNVSSHLTLSRNIVDKFIAYVATGNPNSFPVPEVPEWPRYSVSEPTNMVFNATFADNTIYTHVEADTWREEGLELWVKYAVELSFNSNWRP